MPVVTVTFTPSEDETVSGIPDTVAIAVNVSATIYYTLDGTLPTLFSSVYVDPVELPTDENSVTLSAIAYYLDEMAMLVPTAVLSETYSTDHTDIDRTRYLHFEGVVYSYPGGLDIPYYYDENGDVTFSLDIEESNLLFIDSDRDVAGNFVGTTNEVDPVDPDETATLIDNVIAPFSSPNNSTFNPEAYLIQIDGRAGAPEQVVKLINGPYMSLRNLRTSYGGIEHYNIRGSRYVSGDATRYSINREKGIIVFNYFDTNTNRWVKSIQDLEPAPAQASAAFSPPLVFHWFNMGRHQDSSGTN
jgi:hypothetical protein